MKKRLTALLLAGVLSASLLGGCGINKSAAAAEMNGTQVSMGIVNFYCRFQQASMEDSYKMYFGEDVWNQDISGSGTTMIDTVKDSALKSIHDLYTLKAHMGDYGVELTADEKAKITEAAAAFMSANAGDTLNEMGATQSIVEELLELYTIQSKMRAAIEAEADVNVPDEEANMRGYTQLEIRTDSYTDDEGDTVNYTEDEAAGLKQTAHDLLAELNEPGATLESVAEAHSYETTKETYATYEADDDEGEDDAVTAALKGLKAGEVSGVIETDHALYIVRVDSDTDTDATEEKRESIISQRRNDHYIEVLDGWQEDDGWTVKDKQIEKILFRNSLTITDPNAPAQSADDNAADGAGTGE